MSILSKLKYASLSLEKLLHIYSLSVRSTTEYCSVAWHDSLTQQQCKAIERLQVVALKIILGNNSPIREDGHFDYDKALRQCNLSSLFSRRENWMLVFGKKCIKHPSLKRLFPLNPSIQDDPHNVRRREMFYVNHARPFSDLNSAIPTTQKRINKKYSC